MLPPLILSIGKQEFTAHAQTGSIPPLYAEIPYMSPHLAYQKVRGPLSFLLESVRPVLNIGTHSYIGYDPYATFKIKNGAYEITMGGEKTTGTGNPLPLLHKLTTHYPQRAAEGLPVFQGGAVGLICYDFVHYLEKLPVTTIDDLKIPDAHFLFTDKIISFDNVLQKAWIIVCPGARDQTLDAPTSNWPAHYDNASDELQKMYDLLNSTRSDTEVSPPTQTIDIRHDISETKYTEMVQRTKKYIAAGDIFQANLSLRVSADIGSTDPWDIYTVLRDINPSPFASYLDFGEYVIASSSPERLISVRDNIVQTRPIAGTRPRGKNSSEDAEMRQALLLNPKERAEHIMLIDLERNDLGKVCDYGTIRVDELMVTEDYSHVIHIVSNITGQLLPGKTLMDTIKATFPGGTITGVPKVRCMEIIDELESLRRGPYTGSIGYIGFSGAMDLNIVIRTFLIKNSIAYVQAGAGIVADSDPAMEYRESLKKAEALIKTLEIISG